MKTSIVYLSALLMLFSGALFAQTFEEYKRQQQAEMQKFAEKQLEGMAKLQKEYADYVAMRDQEWTDYLKKEWENYQAFAGNKVPERPKPKESPVYSQTSAETSAIALKTIAPERNTMLSLPPQVEPIRKPVGDERNMRIASFPFYGRQVIVPYDQKLSQCVFPSVNQQLIAAFWENASNTEYTQIGRAHV